MPIDIQAILTKTNHKYMVTIQIHLIVGISQKIGNFTDRENNEGHFFNSGNSHCKSFTKIIKVGGILYIENNTIDQLMY